MANCDTYVMPKSKFKLVFVGDSCVGKTSIISRFVYDYYDVEHDETIGIDFLAKTHTVDEKSVRLKLLDATGNERFRSLIPVHIRDSSVVVVLYAIDNKNSFQSVDKWINEVRREREQEVLIVLVGNKHDLNNREVTELEGQEKAQDHQAYFFETSAKTSHNVQALFDLITRELPDGKETSEFEVRKGTVKMNQLYQTVEGGC